MLVTCALAWTPGAAQGQKASEYELKAIFLVKLLRFVEWPDKNLPPSEPLIVTIVGADPFGPKLDSAFAKQKIDGHRVIVRRAKTVDEIERSHVVFVSSSLSSRLPETLEKLENRPILTVGDTPDFVKHGGMLGLLVEDKRLKFDVNLASSKKRGVKISSQLLRLARRVVQ